MKNKKKQNTIYRVMQSVFSALIGVQSKKNMEEDFNTGKLHHYVITGIIVVTVFVIVLYALVSYILS